MERSNQQRRRPSAAARRRPEKARAISSDRILRTAYMIAGLIIAAVLFVVLFSVLTGGGQFRSRVQAAGSIDYAANELYIWDGEGIPSAYSFLNESSRALVHEARYVQVPDTAVGTQNVAILLQLNDGTIRTENAVLAIREPIIHWEIGTDAVPAQLLGSRYENAVFSEPLSDFKEIGSYPITVIENEKELPFTLVVEDTQAPTVTLKENLTFYINQKLKPEDFIEAYEDVSKVEFHLSEAPPTFSEGEEQIELIATDAAGNSATYNVNYTVAGDGLPPELKGVTKKMQTLAGLPVDYLYGVTAEDEKDGEVEVTAEEPANFSIRTAGTYKIKLSAKDIAGNEAAETVELTVLPSIDDVEKLSTDDMLRIGSYEIRKLEQKTSPENRKDFAKAIFDCVQSHLFYSDTHDVSEWHIAAVEALYNGYGDCHSYYALSRLLLTCGGFENMPVEKVKNYEGDSAHYWNLVKVNGAWYHFDATPRVNSDGFFLFTDEKLDAFSARNGNCFNRDTSLYPATP